MFQKLKGMLQGKDDSQVKHLEAMGFDRTHALNALEVTGGNVEEAVNHLLTNQEALAKATTIDSVTSNFHSNVDGEMRRGRQVSAASLRAGQAAAQRAMNSFNTFGSNKAVLSNKISQSKKSTTGNVTTSKNVKKNFQGTSTAKHNTGNVISGHHPGVKVPSKMTEKSKEEQVLRCSQRLAPHPLAVDTLLQALISVRDHPLNEKYRRIDMTSKGYISVLKDKPGALDLLKAMNFIERYEKKDLVLMQGRTDPALLYLGISALEQVREGDEYKWNKALIRFNREMKHILDGSNFNDQSLQDSEVLKRANYLSKVPSEPANGAGALLQVNVGEVLSLSRRFDGDDTIQDVVHWIGAHGTIIVEKLLGGEWDLVDLNKYPVQSIDVADNMDKTLQVIGCWPSGKLEIRPAPSKEASAQG
jgi:UBA/TS-N domain./PUB domain.